MHSRLWQLGKEMVLQGRRAQVQNAGLPGTSEGRRQVQGQAAPGESLAPRPQMEQGAEWPSLQTLASNL